MPVSLARQLFHKIIRRLARIAAVDYLPVFLDLRGRPVLVVGAGAVALRKIELLLSAGAALTVVAPELDAGVEALAASGRLRVLRGEFAPAHADGMSFVVAATGSAAVNAEV